MKKAQAAVPEMTTNDLAQALSKHGVHLFRDYPGMALNQAQRNLEGRSTYVDDASLKKNKSVVLSVNVMDDGLILGIVERTQKTANPEEGNIFRPVFFDVFGNVVYRPEIDDSHATQKAAMSDLWKQADEIDAVKATIEGAESKQKAMQAEVDTFTELVEEIKP